MENQQPTRWGQVREFRTHVWSSESSNRVAVGRTQAGWPGWAGWWAVWTPLSLIVDHWKLKLWNLGRLVYAARINHPFLEIFYGKLKKLLKKISIFFLIFSKKVFKNGLLMYVQMAQINKTLESSYKTSNFNASLDLGGFLIYIYIYQYFSFIPIQDWSIFQSWKYLEVGVFAVRCNFRSFLAPHFAVWFGQNHNRIALYFCGHMCSVVRFRV